MVATALVLYDDTDDVDDNDNDGNDDAFLTISTIFNRFSYKSHKHAITCFIFANKNNGINICNLPFSVTVYLKKKFSITDTFLYKLKYRRRTQNN